MEVKYSKSGINYSNLEIYIDNILWKVVKSSYFEKKMLLFINSGNFKNEFITFEKQKALEISLILLEKRSYFKKEWLKKMQSKLFDKCLLEEIYQEFLYPYFNEQEEIKRRLEIYYAKGKGIKWVKNKLIPEISLPIEYFNNVLHEVFSEENIINKIRNIEEKKAILKAKGREKTIAFFLRRGFKYNHIAKALLNN